MAGTEREQSKLVKRIFAFYFAFMEDCGSYYPAAQRICR